ncbi:unnamed protein product [Amoebophrya sp. A25]|nr:unnamed protein product [Amoebophrya sp. A25]|eukprot:GSA25T00026436001.1
MLNGGDSLSKASPGGSSLSVTSTSRGRFNQRSTSRSTAASTATTLQRNNIRGAGGSSRASSLGGRGYRRGTSLGATSRSNKRVHNSTAAVVSSSSSDPVRLLELKFINKSLFHLSEVIQGLRKGQKVCFRNSKLTYLLQDWLASKQVYLLATISPSELCFEESLATLRFADAVTNLPKVRNRRLEEFQREAAQLRMETDDNDSSCASANGDETTILIAPRLTPAQLQATRVKTIERCADSGLLLPS